jgi:hypothetical protein
MKNSTIQNIYFLSIVLLIGIGLSGCMTAPDSIPGQTRADIILKRDTCRNIKNIEQACSLANKYNQGILDGFGPKIVDTTVIEAPVTPGGSWRERWTVQRMSGITAIYTVTYQPSPSGGTDIDIKAPPQVVMP